MESRLHKVSPIFILWENIKKLIFPALIALFGTGGSSSWEIYALGAAALISIISIVQYRFYRYWLEEDQIRVKDGIFFKNQRQVKYSRIQNLNLIQGPLHRLLGVVKVQLESASGGKPEAIINVIDLKAVKELQARILQEQPESSGVETGKATKDDAILKLSFGEIVRYGIITNRGLIVVALFFGFMNQFFDEESWNIKGTLNKSVDYIDSGIQSMIPETTMLTNIFIGFVILLVAIAFLWLLSIGLALFKFHGFKLVNKNNKLSATMGLLTRLQGTIPMSRIQTLTVHNSLLHRWFNRVGVSAETAGGVNSDQQGVTMKLIAPVLLATKKHQFLEAIQPEQEWEQVTWSPVEARAWRRVFKISAIIWALVLLTLNVISHWHYLAGLAIAIGWSVFYAKQYIKNTGYYLSNDLIAYKSGVIFRKETYLRVPKTQTIRIKESYFDRRHKMATLELDTAGAAPGAHHIEIPYLNYATAKQMYAQLSHEITNIDFEW